MTRIPDGYAQFRVGSADVVAIVSMAPLVAETLAESTLYEYAAQHPRARPLSGRGVAYVVPLPDGVTCVVVRHSRHGGLFAPVTGDRFLRPSRAPRELETSLRLAALGIKTPQLVAYAVYPAGPLLCRSDVATCEIARSRDLALCLLGQIDDAGKRDVLGATARLIAAMTQSGVRHPDLNLKNVLLTASPTGETEAYVLDVDRVEFGKAGDSAITAANVARLSRSARKWRDLYGANITDADLAWLSAEVERQ